MKINLKIHKCCDNNELRPVMSYILFDKGLIVASTGHVLTVIHIDDLDNILEKEKEQLLKLENKLVHKNAFAKIYNKEIFITDDGLECISEHIFIPFSKEGLKFPDWKSVIENPEKSTDFQMIGLNISHLNLISEALPNSTKGMFKMTFSEASKAVLIQPKGNFKSYAISMPFMLDETDDYVQVLNRETMLFEKVKI